MLRRIGLGSESLVWIGHFGARDTSRNPEVLANLSIIAVALLVCAILGRNLVTGASSGTRSAPKVAGLGPAVGTKLSLPGIDWASANRSVVLVFE